MAYSIKTKNKIIGLRKKGYSYNELSKDFGISKSTLSRWCSDIKLSDKAKQKLNNKIKKGVIVAAERKKKATKTRNNKEKKEINRFVNKISVNNETKLLLCALLYLCEGESSAKSRLAFTNSDPMLVKTFLSLFRESFKIDESKFRIVLHLHDYHNENKLKKFWSNITGIPISQFSKTYQKKNTKTRVRKGYKGCVNIRYYDTNIARKLVYIAEAFLKKGV